MDKRRIAELLLSAAIIIVLLLILIDIVSSKCNNEKQLVPGKPDTTISVTQSPTDTVKTPDFVVTVKTTRKTPPPIIENQKAASGNIDFGDTTGTIPEVADTGKTTWSFCDTMRTGDIIGVELRSAMLPMSIPKDLQASIWEIPAPDSIKTIRITDTSRIVEKRTKWTMVFIGTTLGILATAVLMR